MTYDVAGQVSEVAVQLHRLGLPKTHSWPGHQAPANRILCAKSVVMLAGAGLLGYREMLACIREQCMFGGRQAHLNVFGVEVSLKSVVPRRLCASCEEP